MGSLPKEKIAATTEALHQEALRKLTKSIETKINKGGRRSVSLELLYYEKNPKTNPPDGFTTGEVIECLKAALSNTEYQLKKKQDERPKI